MNEINVDNGSLECEDYDEILWERNEIFIKEDEIGVHVSCDFRNCMMMNAVNQISLFGIDFGNQREVEAFRSQVVRKASQASNLLLEQESKLIAMLSEHRDDIGKCNAVNYHIAVNEEIPEFKESVELP